MGHPFGCPGWKRISSGDEVEDFFRKRHDEAARQGEKTLRTLGGIVALEGKADLHHTPAQEDEADSANQGKDKGRKVVDHRQRIIGGKGRGGKTAGAQHQGGVSGEAEPPLPAEGQSVCGLAVFFTFFQRNKFTQRFLQKHSSVSKYGYGLRKSSGSSSSKSSYRSGE